MCRKLYFSISVVLVLVFAGSVRAQWRQVDWTDGGGDHLWCNPANWSTGEVPFIDNWTGWAVDRPWIDVANMSDPVLISADQTCAVEGGHFVVGDTVDTGPGVALNMTGGEARFMEISPGYSVGGVGTMTMSGGHIQLDHYGYLGMGDGGDGTLIMTGGTIDCNGSTWSGAATTWGSAIIVPKNEQGDGTGHLQLDGGTIKARRLSINDRGTVDITGGKIVLRKYDGVWSGLNTQADVIAGVEADINDANLTAYGGTGIVGIAIRAPEDSNDPNEVWILGRIDAGTAWNPTPEHGAVDILPDIVLEWSAGDYVQPTNGHELYFGTSFAEVNSRSVSAIVLSSATYDAGANLALELGEVYYWAVDEVNSTTTWAGPIWSFAMDRGVAKDPIPANGADEIPKTGATLSWTPGIAAATTNGHDVYFGTDETAVYNADTSSGEFQGNQSAVSWATSNYASTLDLVATYYWRIDEINSSDLWKGDVWSFEVEGRAKNPIPVNGAGDQIFLGLDLSWDAGVDALTHDVYFGSDRTAVLNANNADTTGIYQTTLTIGTESYTVPGQLIVGGRYYWRIDENSASVTAKGHVWSFSIGMFLLVDNFESYANSTALWNVWQDWRFNSSDGTIYRENDPNLIRQPGSQAAMLMFENITKGYPGSVFDVPDMSELAIGSDWTAGGVKALFLYLRGDPCNATVIPLSPSKTLLWEAATPWIELEDTSSNTGYVVHPNPSLMGFEYWYDWNIDLAIFDACGVDLTAIDRFTIGIGGADKTGQGKAMSGIGYIYVDDIRLYPPRCRPETSELVGDFTGDCNVNYDDLDVMGTDWLMADGCVPTLKQDGNITELDSVNAPATWTTGYDGNGALVLDSNIQVDVCDPRLTGLTNMSITAWVRRNGEPYEGYIGIVTSREYGIEDATELAGGKDGDSVGYCWNQITATWQFGSGIVVPDLTWTFIAMSVDPNGCSLYGQPAGGVMDSARHNIILDPGPLQQFDQRFWIGRGRDTSRYFKGAIDDVRIYDYSLRSDEMAYLGSDGVDGNEPDPNCPVYHYKFDDGSGLVAVDDGCGGLVYRPVMSPANMTDPEPKDSRFVNFHDYNILADSWMTQNLWP